MNNKKSKEWLELIISSRTIDLDILYALFQEKALGCINNPNSMSIFFSNNMKETIENMLYDYNNKFQFNWNWNLIIDEDWHLTWKNRFVPIKVSDRITIAPSWDDNNYSKINVKIEPGRAFGTGHHETTCLAIELLEKLVSNTSKVLDLGTGSGILSITSYLLGAKKVDSVEIDADCIDNFQTNIELNQLNGKINFFHYDVLNWKEYNYDIIVANINRNIILKLIPNLKGIKSKSKS